MRVLFDTSVLVAALVQSHPHHEPCRASLSRCERGELDLVLAAHSLAELQCTLTRLPLKPRISPRTAARMAEETRLRPPPHGIAEVVTVTPAEYLEVIDEMVRLALAGAVIYDALIARAARSAEVDAIFTLNTRDFRRVWPEGAGSIHQPA